MGRGRTGKSDMPHINIKLYPGKSEQKKLEMAKAVRKTLSDVSGVWKESDISVSVEEKAPNRFESETKDSFRKSELLLDSDYINYRQPSGMTDYDIDVDQSRFESRIKVVDAHTEGEFCRIVVGGVPEPQGATMIEKKKWLEEHCDHIRTALMLEPRGHHDMFGAILCKPVHEEADFGVVYMETGEFLNMCGHCTIGAVTVVIEAGMIPSHEGENTVVLDTPAGIVRTKAMVKGGKVESVTLTNVPAFVYLENQSVNIDGKDIHFTISFGGSFFALVNTAQLDIGEINAKSVPAYTELGMKILRKIHEEIPVKHPELDIDQVDLVEFYGPTPNPDSADMRNVVIFGDAQADRSPCGTGTSAKLATLYKWGEIEVGQPFVYESFIGTLFKGEIKELTKVGDYDAVVPMVTGYSNLTGIATYLIDPEDPLKYGFSIG